ncbi:MAG TPA: hypothetical protein VFX87_10345 [Methylomirabilota bacterium]|nr:hypothetical protein [Methylomirabilota bacterium]
MRRAGVAIRSRKRRPITRRDWKCDWRRDVRRRVWIGSRARVAAARPLFFTLNAQQVARVRAADLLGAAAMLLGAASWGMLAALLGS